ncbi:MAG: tetratricopeptide repeat protein [Burkholderiales bacterium]|nr:tetratricopeptide repeat protein [Burkholderiales bacterium]
MPAVTLQQALQHAIGVHRAGQLAEAQRLYQEIVAAIPEQRDALHMLGVIAVQQGRQDAHRLLCQARGVAPDTAAAHVHHADVLKALGRYADAVVHYDLALAIDPNLADALNDRGVALREAKRGLDALASFDRAVQARPDFSVAYYNRGLVLQDLARNEEAVASYERAVAIEPNFAQAFNNRGRALIDLGRTDEALASWEQALAIAPDFAEALNNKIAALAARAGAPAVPAAARGYLTEAMAAHDRQRFEEALANYDRALAIAPDLAEVLSNRGAVLNDLGRYSEALDSYARAIAAKPGLADAYSNRAATLIALSRYADALADCDHALAREPRFTDAHNNRGVALTGLSRFDEAVASLDRALALQPGYAAALQNRGGALAYLRRHDEAARDFARALESNAGLPYVRGELVHTRMHVGDWRGHEEDVQRVVDDVRAGERSVTPLALMGMCDAADVQLRCARIWASDKCPPAPAAMWQGQRYRHARLRVAYLSADFRDHAMPSLMAGVFERHDRTRFEVMALAFGPPATGVMAARLEAAFDRFVDVRAQGDEEVAALMRRLEVDVAVDLTGFTQHARTRIFAQRPAPVQVNYLGYPGTMGAPYFDYILADRFVIPEARRESYAEQVVYLPDTFQANDSRRRIAARGPTRAAQGLPEDTVVFCSFNNSYKITPRMFDVWMRILGQVPRSVLWLLGGSPVLEANRRREAASRGVDPGRLVFAARLDYEDHLARYRLADLFLDTLPFNAGATASDALFAGLPVLTCAGDAFAGRMAGSLVTAAGLPWLVTPTLAEYEARAVELGTDAALRGELRRQLARAGEDGPLFDTDRFRRNLEAAYVTMCQRSDDGLPPASFSVAAGP